MATTNGSAESLGTRPLNTQSQPTKVNQPNSKMANIERKLASVRIVTGIRPIPDADAIECAIVGGGWPVVVKKGEFQVGDLAIYFEIDSWIPHELAPFLSKGKEPREYNGMKGERLKTVKLRGQVSQGLLLRFSDISPSFYVVSLAEPYGGREFLRVDQCVWEEGEDFTLEFGIQKWEAPIDACLAGQVRGNFPSFLVKTDQERCLSGDTMVETENGPITIEKICSTDELTLVKSYNLYSKEIELMPVTGMSIIQETGEDWFRIETEKGKTMTVTGEHRIWCEDIKAYRKVREIIPGQIVVCLS